MKVRGLQGFPLDMGLDTSSGASPSWGHGAGSRGALWVTGPTLCCEPLLSGADMGWVLRSTRQLELCYEIIHSEGKLCYCINTVETVIVLI